MKKGNSRSFVAEANLLDSFSSLVVGGGGGGGWYCTGMRNEECGGGGFCGNSIII